MTGDRVIVDTKHWNKPLPNIDLDNEPFWTGLSEHKLLLFRCRTCGSWYWPAAFCRNHTNDPRLGNLGWEEASGNGVIFALSVVHIAYEPGFMDDVPYAHALVRLDEGPMISSTVVGVDAADVEVGMQVEVVFEDHPAEHFTIPRFRLRI